MSTQVQGAPAKELSPAEAEERAEHCFALDQAVKESAQKGREALWELARALHEFDEEAAWSGLGYETLGEWLADSDVSLTRSTYFRLTQVYRELVLRRQLPMSTAAELEVSKVQIVLPKVKAGSVKLADAIADVKALGARDLRVKYMRRPDPADLSGADDDLDTGGLNVETDDVGSYVEPPVNPGDDTPQWAGETDPDEEPVVEEVEVVDGHAEEVAPAPEKKPAHNAHHVPSGQLPVLVAQARKALAIPQRSGPQRRLDLEAVKTVRAALEALVEELDR